MSFSPPLLLHMPPHRMVVAWTAVTMGYYSDTEVCSELPEEPALVSLYILNKLTTILTAESGVIHGMPETDSPSYTRLKLVKSNNLDNMQNLWVSPFHLYMLRFRQKHKN
jgi:hypothetical protein